MKKVLAAAISIMSLSLLAGSASAADEICGSLELRCINGSMNCVSRDVIIQGNGTVVTIDAQNEQVASYLEAHHGKTSFACASGDLSSDGESIYAVQITNPTHPAVSGFSGRQ
jgi:hypothetical protein